MISLLAGFATFILLGATTPGLPELGAAPWFSGLGGQNFGLIAQAGSAASESEATETPAAESSAATPADVRPANGESSSSGSETGVENRTTAANKAKSPEELSFVERLFASGILLPMGLVFLFYAIFLAPERRKKAEEAKLMAAIKKNDRVVTIGGIHGTVASAPGESDIVTIKIDESTGAKIRVNRSAIARIVNETAATDDKDTADNTSK